MAFGGRPANPEWQPCSLVTSPDESSYPRQSERVITEAKREWRACGE